MLSEKRTAAGVTPSGEAVDRAPWDQPDWAEETAAWLTARLTEPGSLRRIRRRPWSIVARVKSAEGVHWFKQHYSPVAPEPLLTSRLAQHVPQFVADVVAADEARLLTRHAGRRLHRLVRDQDVAPLWEHVATRYAELLIELSSIPLDVTAADARPAQLAARFGRQVEAAVDQLGETIPTTLVHLDVGSENVCVRRGEPVFVDWALVAVAHPFCGLTKPIKNLMHRYGATLDGAGIRRVRDAFLEPWTTYAPPKELRRIFHAAYRLGFLCRALTREHLVTQIPTSALAFWESKILAEIAAFETSLAAERIADPASRFIPE
jgi:hypothetical protein